MNPFTSQTRLLAAATVFMLTTGCSGFAVDTPGVDRLAEQFENFNQKDFNSQPGLTAATNELLAVDDYLGIVTDTTGGLLALDPLADGLPLTDGLLGSDGLIAGDGLLAGDTALSNGLLGSDAALIGGDSGLDISGLVGSLNL